MCLFDMARNSGRHLTTPLIMNAFTPRSYMFDIKHSVFNIEHIANIEACEVSLEPTLSAVVSRYSVDFICRVDASGGLAGADIHRHD